MKLLLNIIWLVFGGFWLFVSYMLAGIFYCVLIITIPAGIASFRIGMYALWPFGRTVVSRPTSGGWSFIGNVLWVILAGWMIALVHLGTGIVQCVTIIGIPLGIANFKMIPVSLFPMGKEIIASDQAYGPYHR